MSMRRFVVVTPVAGLVALLTLAVSVSGQSGPEPPTNLRVVAMTGSSVTFAWSAPLSGTSPTGYQIEGGVAPGQVLGSVPVGLVQAVTIAMPTGSFYVRVRTMSASATSAASNEIPVLVNVAAAPSAPSALLGLVASDSLSLAWTNTYARGIPTGLVLDVTGTTTASLPIGLSETISFAGVPAGNYSVTLRATNASGSSAASNAVALAVPSVCSGPPIAPSLTAYQSSGTVYVRWEPGGSGPAPTSYRADVSGSYTGSFTLATRTLTSAAPAGTYNFTVTALNACGASPASPLSSVTILSSSPSGGTASVVQARYKSMVTVTVGATSITLRSQGVPDHVTPYWGVGNALYEAQLSGQTVTPGSLQSQTFAMTIPLNPAAASTKEATTLGPIGMALNGVAIYNDREGGNVPVDSSVLLTMDRAGAHSGPGGLYHYHFDGDFTSYDDANLIGFLRDGFPIYGRKDADGTYPSNLDANGGHVGATGDFTSIYHYHASSVAYLNSRFYILKSGSYHGTKGTFTF